MSKQKITIKDLPGEEKQKIGELLMKLSSETKEKERLKQMLEDDKKLYESRINTLKEQSILQQSQANYNEFKAESFGQSFIGGKDSNKNPTVNDIQTLRMKFDEVLETVKKAAKTNETILTRINNESIMEDKPEMGYPQPIQQQQQQQQHNANVVDEDLIGGNILQTSMMDDIKKYGEEDKSFISSNDDMFSGLMSTSKKSKIDASAMPTLNIKKYFEYDPQGNSNNNNTQNQSQTMLFNTHHQSSQNKYKEMLGRIREKSQEQNHNTISNRGSNNNTMYIQSQINKENYTIESTNHMTHSNNINNISISRDIQLNYNTNQKASNTPQSYVPQSITNISCVSTSNNNNNMNNNNTFLCEGTEYDNVLNFLKNNEIQKPKNSSTMQNDDDLQMSSLSIITSKCDEIANQNLFNYIFEVEKKNTPNESFNQTPSPQPTPFPSSTNANPIDKDLDTEDIYQEDPVSYEMDEVEKEINSLHEKTSQSLSSTKHPLSSQTNNNKPQSKAKAKSKQYKTKFANGCNRLYEDFQKINSKYI